MQLAKATQTHVAHRTAPQKPSVEPARHVAPQVSRPSGACACGGGCPRCSHAKDHSQRHSQGHNQTQSQGHSQDYSQQGRSEGENDSAASETEATPAPIAGEEAEAVPAATPPAVATVTPNIGSSGSTLAHVPACGNQPTIAFTAGPANATPVTWTLAAGTAQVATDTALTPSANTRTADLVLGATQTGGTLSVRAETQGGWYALTYALASHPTAISSTSAIGNPTTSTNYGGVFDHVFTSNDGIVASLNQVAVGERFPNLPDPSSASHTIPITPFGSFTLNTGTLPNAASGSSGNWFLTSAGELGGIHDNVTIGKAGIDLGRHLVSDSNPTPTYPVPAEFVVDQQFHWWCPHAAAGSRWTQFAATTHTRRLRLNTAGDEAEFVASVRGEENVMPYEVGTGAGRTAVRNAQATPATTPPSASGSGATPITVQISAQVFPSTESVHYSIVGASLGCAIDAGTGLLTVGTQTGTVKVRVADSSGGPNFDEVDLTIATPAAPTPPAAAPAPGTPGSPPPPNPPPQTTP